MEQLSKEKLYTLRWYNSEMTKATAILNIDRLNALIEQQYDLLTELLNEDTAVVTVPVKPIETTKPVPSVPIAPIIPDKSRPSVGDKNAKLSWVPWAKIKKDGLKPSGKYPKGYPEGLVVHFTAGNYRAKDNATGILEYGNSMGFGYMALDTDGSLHQWQSLADWDSHAGVSAWVIDGTKVDGVSSRFVGVEICNPGRLEFHEGNYYAWFDITKDKSNKVISARNPIKPKDCRIFRENKDNILAGIYLPYTKEQEAELIRLCLWLKQNNPSVFSFNNVVGHDEVAGPKGIGYWRKNDPGGALSMTMSEFRKKLIDLYGEA